MMILFLKLIRKVYFLLTKGKRKEFQKNIEFFDQQANDLLYKELHNNQPYMVSKFGSIELNALLQHQMNQRAKYSLKNYIDFIFLRVPCLWWKENIRGLCSNAGFFPENEDLLPRFYETYLEAIREIDVLGSYLYGENYFKEELHNAKKVNLDGYYAPFFWKNPWTRCLKGKKVLVVHPFTEEIQQQYARRSEIWDNPDILPEFNLITYKSVQSMLNSKTEYNTWFEALNKMSEDISKIDFDIALVGCGAYGMPLSARIKKMGKKVVHLAGWTQILFGIIGKRWEDNPQVAKYINKSWIRPNASNKPANASSVENACYW